MDIEFIKDISVLIIIVATIFNLFVIYKNLKIAENREKEKNPVIDIKVDCLPPYNSQNKKTILMLKNIGTKSTNPNMKTSLSCTWMPFISFQFDVPTENYILEPNEEIIWKFKLSEDVPVSGTIFIEVLDLKTVRRYIFFKNYIQARWELTEQI